MRLEANDMLCMAGLLLLRGACVALGVRECEGHACQWCLATVAGGLGSCSKPSSCPGVPSTKPHLQHRQHQHTCTESQDEAIRQSHQKDHLHLPS